MDFDIDHLPPFANEYNRQLDNEVREQEKRVAALEAEASETKARMDVMDAHSKALSQTVSINSNLLEAKKRESESERHLAQVNERQAAKVIQEAATLDTKQQEIKDKLNGVQNNIFKTTERVEAFRQQMNWNQEQLEQWAQAEKQKEDDNLSLLRYTKADDAKIKEYTLSIDKLIKDGLKKKSELDAEITETRAAQIQLDKTGEAYKKMHQERQDLINQWSEAIEAMGQRDTALVAVEESIAALTVEEGKKKEILREKQKFLDSQKSNNQALEAKIAVADRQLAKVRPQYSAAQAAIIEYQDEVETLRNTVGKTATSLETKKAEVLFLKRDILEKKARVERVKQVLTATQSQLRNEFSRTDSLDQRAKQLEEYHKQEEARNKAMEKELTDLKQQTFKHSQDMFHLKQREANLLSEISGSSAASKNLQSKIHKLDSESMKQMELVYNQEYQLQLLERKISRAQGERSNEEKAALAAKIRSLSAELDSTSQTSSLLSSQLKKVEDDVKVARRETESSLKDREVMEGRINELVLDNESAARSLKAVVKTKEELLIAENFVRLDVKRLRDILYKRADEVYNLGNRKLQLKLAMEERQHEISIHRDALRDQVRALESDKSTLVKELKEVQSRVENLKKKYELHLFRYAPQGEELGEKSQAYYVIKAAQEKEELQQMGDALDMEIAKAEKELRGLINTLKVLNSQNEKLHSHRSKADLSPEDNELQSKLEEEYDEAKRQYEEKRRDIAVLQTELHAQQRIANEKARQCDELSSQVNAGLNAKNQLERELIDQNTKFQRARQQFVKVGKAFKQKQGLADNQETIFEKELLLHDKRDQVNKQLYNIAQFAKQHPELEHELVQLAAEFSLVLPSSPSAFSRQSNRSAGSVSSSASFSSPSSLRPPIGSPSLSPSPSYSPPMQKSISAQRPPPSSSSTRTPPRTPTTSSPQSRPTSSARAPSPSPTRPATSSKPVQPLVFDNINISSSNSKPASPSNSRLSSPTTTPKLSSSKPPSARLKTPVQSPKASPKSSLSRPSSSSSNVSMSGFEINGRSASSQKAQ